MTDVEVMDKAIRKSLEQGYEDWWDTPFTIKDIGAAGFLEVEVPDDPDLLGWGFHQVHINEVIFDHDFAKALWGEDLITINQGCAIEDTDHVPLSDYWRLHFMNSWNYDMPQWAFHLTKMVIADDPIQYLRDNL